MNESLTPWNDFKTSIILFSTSGFWRPFSVEYDRLIADMKDGIGRATTAGLMVEAIEALATERMKDDLNILCYWIILILGRNV